MVPPRFYDQGIKFSVLMPNHALLAENDLLWLSRVTKGTALSDVHRHVLVRMRHGDALTNKSLREAFPMDSRKATRLLSDLVETGLAEAHGERGGRVYRLSAPLAEGDNQTRLQVADDTLPDTAEKIVAVLSSGPATRAELQERAGLSERQVQYALQSLREGGRVQLEGGRGKRSSYYFLVDAAAQR